MERKDIRKYQLAQLELLKYADKFCKENGIRYFLVYGTLIGAIREKGFIPWDPDIDIAMFRPDYERFCSLFAEKGDRRIFMDNYNTNMRHISQHVILKVKDTHVKHTNSSISKSARDENDGIYIDVFPIDGASSDSNKNQVRFKRIKRLRYLENLKRAPFYQETTFFAKIVKRVVSFLLRPISFQWIARKIRGIQQLVPVSDSNLCAIWICSVLVVFDKEVFEKSEAGGRSLRLCEFEGSDFPVPLQSEKFLTMVYGDYMVPPPEEERYTYLDGVEVDYGPYKDSFKLC